MVKIRRTNRLIGLMKILSDHPGRLFPLSQFAEYFGTAKSTVSEDILSIREALEDFNLGTIETVTGAAGGIKFWPFPNEVQKNQVLQDLAQRFSEAERILPGNYLYMSDVLYNPQLMRQVGEIFACRFLNHKPDYVMTVETKGIPLAIATAQVFDVPVVVVRRETRVTEGPTVNINYVSGSNRRISTMSVGKRSIAPNSRVLIVDDFMKAGATAKALVDLTKEIGAEVVGVGVVIATAEPQKKLCDGYETLFWLNEIEEESGKIVLEIAQEKSKSKKRK
jgi:pur operon repressor, Bacillus subtilis type